MTTERRIGMVGTTAVHAVLLVGALWSARRVVEPTQEVFAVDLVAAAPPERTTERAPDETPTPQPPKSVEEAPILRTTKKPPEKTPPVKVEKTPEKPPVTSSNRQVQPLPGETPRDGQNVMNLSIPGFDSRNKWYTDNIVDKLMGHFLRSPRPGNPEIEVRFRILKDGSVTGITMVRASRFVTANTDALSAVELTGRLKEFGPLPEGLTELDVSFIFKARNP